MRMACLLASTVLVSVCLANAQSTHPIPPGIRDGEQRINNQQTDPPRAAQPRPADSAKLQAEAAQLRELAAGLPAAVDQVTKGSMPKDLNDNLKKIEKLAKHLRSDINP
jgi:hypothetical protein